MGKDSKIKSYAQDILTGLVYVHAQNIIHADIKIENVLMQSSDVDGEINLVKLCDFGLSQELGSNGKALVKVRQGTIGYIAPEVRANEYID